MDLAGSWSNSKSFMPPFGHALGVSQWATRTSPRDAATEEGWIVEQNENKSGKT